MGSKRFDQHMTLSQTTYLACKIPRKEGNRHFLAVRLLRVRPCLNVNANSTLYLRRLVSSQSAKESSFSSLPIPNKEELNATIVTRPVVVKGQTNDEIYPIMVDRNTLYSRQGMPRTKQCL